MKLAMMSKVANPEDEIVRTNLVRFRDEAGLSQAEAAEFSGVGLDNLRRYESGKVNSVPAGVLRALAVAYGHAMDDFYSSSPPKANLTEADVFFLKTRPGAEVDSDTYAVVRRAIDEANKKVRGKKGKR